MCTYTLHWNELKINGMNIVGRFLCVCMCVCTYYMSGCNILYVQSSGSTLLFDESLEFA